MDSILNELTSIDGVLGCFVFDEAGQILGEQLPRMYISLLPQIVQALQRSFAPLQAEDPDWMLNELVVGFGEGFLSLREASGNYLAVLCANDTKSSFFNVAMNVATMKLKRGVPMNSSPPAPANPSRTNIQTGNHGSFAGARHGMQNVGTNHWSTSDSGGGERPIPQDAVGRDFVLAVARELARYLGPAAKVVLKSCLQRLGVSSRTLSLSQCSALMTMLEAELSSSEERIAFRGEVQALLQDSGFNLTLG